MQLGKIAIVGTGYVGLVQGAVLAEFGMNVTCLDVAEEKILGLQKGVLPIYEPGLQELVDKNAAAGRLRFSTDMRQAVEECAMIFITVGTPPLPDGGVDLRHVRQVARDIGRYMDGYRVVVNKSTVPVGTGAEVEGIIAGGLAARGVELEFDVVSNPEFLREGKAVRDCLMPDRVVIGAGSERARNLLKQVYNVLFINQTPFVMTDVQTAELIKYACNAFLAVKVSYINEIALLADRVGANVQQVARAMGMDGRISPKFLHPGPGYGGSCFPKDTRAITATAARNGEELMVVEAAIRANQKQKERMVRRVLDGIAPGGEPRGLTLAVWGLSFKPETGDMRDAPAIDLIRGVVGAGLHVRAYCPKGMEESRHWLADCAHAITYCEDEYTAAEGADGLVLMTEWHQFRGADLARVRERMRGDAFFDLRNVFWQHPAVREIFRYQGVGCG